MPKFNKQYFIQKFSAIPEDKWCTGVTRNQQGQCCALGHCGETAMQNDSDDNYGPEAKALIDLFAHKTESRRKHWGIVNVNDSCEHVDKRGNKLPKQNVLAALQALPDNT